MDAAFAFTVSQQQHQLSLLDCLEPCIPYLTAMQWQALLETGNIFLDGQVCLENCVLIQGQQVRYTIADYEEAPVDTHWQLLWHNHDIAAIHKPANLPVSRTTRNVYNTLIQLLRRESPWPDAHLLHRLDLETSGIILIGQNNAAASRHQPALGALLKRKIYHAVVHGEPTWQTLEYQCDLNTLKDSAIRCKMHVVSDGLGKTSTTEFTVLKRFNGFTLVQCELFSGRKHQIRAHLSAMGHPIVGDKIYANDGEYYLKRLEDRVTQADTDKLLTPHHLLHAFEVHIQTQATEPVQAIKDEYYSAAWQDFIKVLETKL